MIYGSTAHWVTYFSHLMWSFPMRSQFCIIMWSMIHAKISNPTFVYIIAHGQQCSGSNCRKKAASSSYTEHSSVKFWLNNLMLLAYSYKSISLPQGTNNQPSYFFMAAKTSLDSWNLARAGDAEEYLRDICEIFPICVGPRRCKYCVCIFWPISTTMGSGTDCQSCTLADRRSRKHCHERWLGIRNMSTLRLSDTIYA